MSDTPIPLSVGVYLHSSCRGETVGQIKRIGKDANDRDMVDFEFPGEDINEHLYTNEGAAEIVASGTYNACRVRVPLGVRLIMADVPYFMTEYGAISLETPGNGCYRCTGLFGLRDKP